MLIVLVTVAVVVLTVVAIVVMVPPYSPSPSPSSSFSAYVGHHWHRRSRFISSSLPPWSSSSSAVVHAVIAIVTISIAIWFVLKSPFIRPMITRLPRLTRLRRCSPGDRLHRLSENKPTCKPACLLVFIHLHSHFDSSQVLGLPSSSVDEPGVPGQTDELGNPNTWLESKWLCR